MKNELKGKVAVISGASSGFGRSIALALGEKGTHLALLARREDRLLELQKEIQKKFDVRVFIKKCDVQNSASISAFHEACMKTFENVDILINNAGGAHGKDPFLEAKEEDWATMFETNCMGVFRLTQAFLPGMIRSGGGDVLMIGSIAGKTAYEGGAGYCGTKFALKAMTEALRMEVLGKNVRVMSVDPGLADTEFSLVRFKGDEKASRDIYDGFEPLHAEDIAEIVIFALSRPRHVNLDNVLVMPLAQGSTYKIHRK